MTSIDSLTVGIIQNLDEKIPGIIAYDEKKKQGFKEPCFFIKVLNSAQDKEFNIRYKRHVVYDIHYFSDKEEINTDCNNMADKLYEVLEYININGSLYRASKMTHEVVDDVLHFSLKFDYRVIREAEEPVKMGKLKVEVKANGGK